MTSTANPMPTTILTSQHLDYVLDFRSRPDATLDDLGNFLDSVMHVTKIGYAQVSRKTHTSLNQSRGAGPFPPLIAATEIHTHFGAVLVGMQGPHYQCSIVYPMRINGKPAALPIRPVDVEQWCEQQDIPYNDGNLSLTPDQSFAFRMRFDVNLEKI